MMRNTVPIPDRMKNLDIDHRGFPIPYIVLIDDSGVPHFKVNDQTKTIECFLRSKCHVCGEKVEDDDKWQVGGPLSAYHPNGAFNDPLIHRECAEYALQVCPYMAFSQYEGKPVNVSKIASEEKILLVDTTQSKDRIPYFCLVKVGIGGVGFHPISGLIYKAIQPYLEEHFWLDGKEISREDAISLFNFENIEP